MAVLTKKSARVPLDDDKIVELYWVRDQKAIDETDFKYKKYLYTIAYNIVHDTHDSEECLNDTYLGTWNAIPPSRPNVFKAFITTVMRRSAINRYNSNTRKGRVPSEMTVSLHELDDLLSDGESVESDFDAESFGKVLSDFLRSLSERKRFIFMSRYYLSDSVVAIAGELNLSRSTVNKELASIRSELKQELERQGYIL